MAQLLHFPLSQHRIQPLPSAGGNGSTFRSRAAQRSTKLQPIAANSGFRTTDLASVIPIGGPGPVIPPAVIPPTPVPVIPPAVIPPTPGPVIPPTPVPFVPVDPFPVTIGKSNFPTGFYWGASTSAFQIEGAEHEGGRKDCVWDTFIREDPSRISDGTNASIACGSYYKYKEDVKLLKNAGMNAYRFSIAWPRILPNGSLAGGINKEGIRYYNNLINELVANGIEPFATLFHWDLPQALEDKYLGFLDRKIVEDYKDFADICFREFGDRVKRWITMNEPSNYSCFGYDSGNGAPGRCSVPPVSCAAGDSAREPYMVTHNIILAHAEAARLYKENYQPTQKGYIGITLVSHWFKPYSTLSKEHVEAAGRAMDFMLGWYMDPLVYGDYPFTMKAIVRERLPTFTEEESKRVKGSFDFIGMNYYTSYYAYSIPFGNGQGISYAADQHVKDLEDKGGVTVGEQTTSPMLVCPEGFKDLLLYVKEKYRNPPIIITENGTGETDHGQLSFEEALNDLDRIKFYNSHLTKLLQAIKLGANVKGYLTWALIDNFEWVSGYSCRYGLAYTDYNDDCQRFPKDSYKWFTKFLQS